MLRDVGCMAEENLGYENSSGIEPKCSHQWFMDTCEPKMFSSKKQAVEDVSGRPISGVSHVNVSQWDTNSGFHSRNRNHHYLASQKHYFPYWILL